MLSVIHLDATSHANCPTFHGQCHRRAAAAARMARGDVLLNSACHMTRELDGGSKFIELSIRYGQRPLFVMTTPNCLTVCDLSWFTVTPKSELLKHSWSANTCAMLNHNLTDYCRSSVNINCLDCVRSTDSLLEGNVYCGPILGLDVYTQVLEFGKIGWCFTFCSVICADIWVRYRFVRKKIGSLTRIINTSWSIKVKF